MPSALTLKRQIENQLANQEDPWPRMLLNDPARNRWFLARVSDGPQYGTIDMTKFSCTLDSRFAVILLSGNDSDPNDLAVGAVGLLVGVIDSGVFGEPKKSFHHVHAEQKWTLRQAQPSFERLLDQLMAMPEVLAEEIPQRVFDMGAGAFSDLNASQAMIEREDGRHVREFIADVSRRMVDGSTCS